MRSVGDCKPVVLENDGVLTAKGRAQGRGPMGFSPAAAVAIKPSQSSVARPALRIHAAGGHEGAVAVARALGAADRPGQ
jgi:hypothetical protein